MLLHVNNDMENGVIAKIPLALDKDVKAFRGCDRFRDFFGR